MFVALGARRRRSGRRLRGHIRYLSIIAGIAIIIMGLHFLGVFTDRAVLLPRERFDLEKPVGLWGAYVMGLAFAFGWTPCIGPVLATILAVAGVEATVARARCCWRSIRSGSACRS